MSRKIFYSFIALICFAIASSCNGDKSKADTSDKSAELNKMYPEIPDLKLIRSYKNDELFSELQQRYASNLIKLKNEASNADAKLIVIILTPEETTKASSDFIKAQCASNGIDLYDLTGDLKRHKIKDITQIPFDSHWSKQGARIISELLTPIIQKYDNARSNIKYKDNERTETFGDLSPGQNEILDGGKDLPYNLITNKQGLRMDHDLMFPKTKQTILFLGDSQIYSPFLDNKDISSALLQKVFPNKEILNAGVIGYSMDDYAGLLKDKARFAEPDLIFVFTNTNDIPDMFFTQRNHVGRNRSGILPSSSEKDFYNTVYNKK